MRQAYQDGLFQQAAPPGEAELRLGKFTVRDYQEDAVLRLREAIARLKREGRPPMVILHAPVGAGKTLISAIITSLGLSKGSRVLFLAYGRNLIFQSAQKFREAGLGAHVSTIIADSGGQMHLSRPIQIASISTLRSRVFNQGRFPLPDADLVVVDECFSFDTQVRLADGTTAAIGNLANGGYKGEVMSYNEATGLLEPRRVIGHIRKEPSQGVLRVHLNGGKRHIVCTPNHEILTARGWQRADALKPGDLVVSQTSCVVAPRLSDDALQVVLGSILGDGSLQLPRAGAIGPRLAVVHGEAQAEYLAYKAGAFQSTNFSRQVSGFTSKRNIHRFITRCHAELNDFLGLSQQEVIGRLNLLGLAIYYLDDGSYQPRSGYGIIASYSLNDEALVALLDKLAAYGVEASIYRTAKGPVVRMKRDAMLRFASLIAPYVPDVMRYKLPPGDYQAPKPLDSGAGDVGWNRVVKVEQASLTGKPWRRDVYCLAVEGNHNFVLGNGAVVHNCHNTLAPTFRRALRHYQGVPVIGLTATPAGPDGMGLAHVGWQEIVPTLNMRQLQERGFLVPLRYFIPSFPDLTGVRVRNGDYDPNELEAAYMDDAQLVAHPIEWYLRHGEGRKFVVFATSVRHSRHIADMFQRAGINCAHVDADVSKDRELMASIMSDPTIQGHSSFGVFMEGTDYPAWSYLIDCRPTKQTRRQVQKVGRVTRPAPGKECLSADTLILTDKGLVRIDQITLDHKVWDGVSFVQHGGAVCKGTKPVMSYQGLTATPDHPVMTREGWVTLHEAASRRLGIVKTGLGRRPIRYTGDSKPQDRGQYLETHGGGALHPLWARLHGSLPQHTPPQCRQLLPGLQASHPHHSTPLAISAHAGATEPLHEPPRPRVAQLWRQGHPVQIFRRKLSGILGVREPGPSPKPPLAVRPHRQRRALRAWQLAVGATRSKREQYPQGGWHPSEALCIVPASVPTRPIRRQHPAQAHLPRPDGRRDSPALAHPVLQAEGEVWDIHNAGPLQRFTANGRLVHNCSIIADHAGNWYRHGPVEDITEWTLDGEEPIQRRVEQRLRAEPDPVVCTQCQHVHPPGMRCPNCGHMPHRRVSPEGVEYVEGQLYEVERVRQQRSEAARRAERERKEFWASQDGKRRFLQECYAIAQEKGRPKEWARQMYAMRYRERPSRVDEGLPPEPPSEATHKYLASLRIRWAKGKGRRM